MVLRQRRHPNLWENPLRDPTNIFLEGQIPDEGPVDLSLGTRDVDITGWPFPGLPSLDEPPVTLPTPVLYQSPGWQSQLPVPRVVEQKQYRFIDPRRVQAEVAPGVPVEGIFEPDIVDFGPPIARLRVCL